MELEEAVKTVIAITERHERQLELAEEVARVELARRRQGRDDRAQASEAGDDRR